MVSLATDLNHALVSAELKKAKTEVTQAKQAAKQAGDLAGQAQASAAKAASNVAAARKQADQAVKTASQASEGVEGLKITLSDNLQNVWGSIAMMSNNINLRVTKGDVINQINISPETILIDGKRVHITGQTTIDNGIIGTAMIADAAITNAKISQLSADKINTGTLAAARIAAGSITSDKLTISNGFIQTVMIRDAAITSAKIAYIDASKITTGYLNADRIQAGSISADKLAANAIQVGLAGWNQNIRISPTQISWYNGSRLEGTISSRGMQFWYGERYVGELSRGGKKNNENIQGISMSLANQGDYVAWTYQTQANGTFYTCLTLDPKGKFYGSAGIHLGSDLRTNGYKFYTSANRYVTLQDVSLQGRGTHPGWVGPTALSKVVFHTYDVMVVTNGSFYNMTRLFDRVGDLMNRVNGILGLLNQGWISKITSRADGSISWTYFDNTGYQKMSTNLA